MKMNVTLVEHAKILGHFFYLSSPNDTTFKTIEEVPNYVITAVHHFYILIALEYLVLYLKGEDGKLRVNDGITSFSGGMLMELVRLIFKGLEFKAYLYIYENHCLYNLPWDSTITWIIAALAVDFCYYWVHRSCHEINIMWAAHQMHHSSEYFNLTTAVRQSVFQWVFAWPFYVPMAFFVPPSHFLIHNQINLLYQFWIHGAAVSKLPKPIEYIFNTPSHHRVHHGCNRYCIDKNYAGWLIIWDRMFGTFQPEEEDIVYGLAHSVDSFNPLWIQVHHLVYMWGVFKEADGIGNKLKTIFYGPGWAPGKPRCGLVEDLPDHKAPEPQYNPALSVWYSIYMLMHFFIVTYAYFIISTYADPVSLNGIGVMSFMVLSLSSIGAIADKSSWATPLETFRCFFTFLILRFLHIAPILQAVFFSCCIFWGYFLVNNQTSTMKKMS